VLSWYWSRSWHERNLLLMLMLHYECVVIFAKFLKIFFTILL